MLAKFRICESCFVRPFSTATVRRCQLFAYVNNSAEEGAYKVIIAKNREESYTRPTRVAGFWPSYPSCVGGVDLEPGRGHGTWLGMTKQGKICSLLDILGSFPERKRKSRAHLVNDYLVSDFSGQAYLRKLRKEKDMYHPFTLVTIEKRKASWSVDIFCAIEDSLLFQIPSSSGAFVCASNAPYSRPWRKTLYGKEQFMKIVEETGHTNQRDQLFNRLLCLMRDKSNHLPDPQLEKQGRGCLDDAILQAGGSIFVEAPSCNFGSRTHSFILIDSDDNVEFIEQTMRTPDDPNWDTTLLNFKLAPSPSS